MANKKISELTDAGTITTSDEIPLARAGRTYKAKIGLSIVPAGCVMAFAGTTIPEGWLKCNGEAIPNGQGTVQGKTDNFSTLYSIIGAKLPDIRGYFIRGLDDGRGVDSGRQIRSSQDDIFKLHSHGGSTGLQGQGQGGNGSQGTTQYSNYNKNQEKLNWVNLSYDVPDEGGVETRPKNVALHYIIKY